MPLPAALTQLLPLAGEASNKMQGIKDKVFNFGTQWWFNKDQRDREDHVYGKQRRDAIADWNMINEYNSPKNQMARFKEAGLNPNLIYGQTNEAAPVRSSDGSSSGGRAPDMSTTPPNIMSYFDAEQKMAQTNQLAELREVLEVEKALKAAQSLGAIASADKTRADTDMTRAQLQQFNDTRSITLETLKQNLEKAKADTQYTINQDIRAAMRNTEDIRLIRQQVLTAMAQRARTETERKAILQRIKNDEVEQQIKTWELEQRKQGKNPGDNWFFRKVQDLIGRDMDAIINAKPGDWLNNPGLN